jgi:hypothetical protein
MITDNLFNLIDKGRNGFNQGISMDLPKYESVTDGNTRQTYTLIISDSGTGKSTFALYAYSYKPLVKTLDNDNFFELYFSLEMNAELVLAKLLCIHLWEEYHICISIKELLSRKRNYILPEYIYKCVTESKEWLNRIEKDKLIIYDKSLNADKMYEIILGKLKERGTFKETESSIIYTPNNPNLVFNVIIDHISLLRPAKGRSLKEEIDLASAYLVNLRNICGISPVVIQQTNRNQKSIERRKQGLSDFNIADAKDSSNPSQDCEIMISIYNPNRERLATSDHYNITELGDKYRSITILKSRWGESDYKIAMNFFGGVGIFRELPRPEEINDYEKYKYLIPPKSSKDRNDEDNDETNLTFIL